MNHCKKHSYYSSTCPDCRKIRKVDYAKSSDTPVSPFSSSDTPISMPDFSSPDTSSGGDGGFSGGGGDGGGGGASGSW